MWIDCSVEGESEWPFARVRRSDILRRADCLIRSQRERAPRRDGPDVGLDREALGRRRIIPDRRKRCAPPSGDVRSNSLSDGAPGTVVEMRLELVFD